MSVLHKPRRLGVALLSQILNSLSNLVVTLSVARAASTREFGLFALTWTATVLSTSGIRATFGLAIQLKPQRLPRGRTVCGSLGLAVLGAAAAGLLLAIFRGASEPAWLMLLIATPLVAAGYEAVRQLVIATVALSRGAAMDFLWLLAVTLVSVASAVERLPYPTRVTVVLVAWLGGGIVAAAAGLRWLPISHSGGEMSDWIRSARPLLLTGAREWGAATLMGQASVFAMAALASLESVGLVKLTQLIYSPFSIALGGLTMALAPSLRAGGQSARESLRAVGQVSAVVVAGLAVFLLVVVALPGPFWSLAIGDGKWARLEPVVVAAWVSVAAAAVSTCLVLFLRSVGLVREALRGRYHALLSEPLLVAAAAPFGAVLIGGALSLSQLVGVARLTQYTRRATAVT
jgi:hypothetical protein